MRGDPDLPTARFRSQAAWEAWLEQHHATSPGVWLELAKAAAGVASVSYAEALESALCFGWIDGQKAALDARYWRQRFTPRRPRSKWSRINCAKALALQEAGRLRAAGVREVEAAKRDGRWERAYESQQAMGVPDDLKAMLEAHPLARTRFEALDSANRYAILYRIQDARKAETRAGRIRKYVDMLLAGGTIH
ncbi:MAG: YdeI family protein [Gemmatimonadales bacterium]